MLKWIQTVLAAARKADSSVFVLVVDVKYGSGHHKNSHTLDPETTTEKRNKAKQEEQRKTAGKL